MAKFKMSWDPHPFTLAKVIDGLPVKIRQTAVKGVNTIAKQAVRDLFSLTPGSELPKGWRAEESQTPAQYRVTVRNSDPRAYKRIRVGSGTTNLVEILEYGSRPHIIRRKTSKALRFRADSGKIVFAKLVRHPGTRPYAMVRISRLRAAVKVAKLQVAISKMIDSELKKK